MVVGPSATEQVRPMLATSGPLPHGDGWAFEFHWDGMRSLAEVGPRHTLLRSSTERSIATSYPELAMLGEVVAGGRRLLLDGQLVALDAAGRPSRSRLAQRMNVEQPTPGLLRRVPVAYYVFDVLALDGRPILRLPYRQRRELLTELLPGVDGPVVAPPYFLDTDGQAVLDTAARYGLDGVVAKRADSTYQPGRRSRSWVRTALRHRREVVIGGWTAGGGSRGGALGSLLVGVPTDQGLRYVGRVGTGFTRATHRMLLEQLAGLERRASPFVDPLSPELVRGVHWVAPQLVGEVEHRAPGADGRLRHATWRGLLPGRTAPVPAVPVPGVPLPGVPQPRVPQPRVPLSGVPLSGAPLSGAPSDAVPEEADPARLRESARLAHAEVAALRAQISPHFVYNALTTAAAFVRTDPAQARELLVDFAEFTRYSFRTGAASTLGEEMANIGRYLRLEQARFGDRLRVALDVDSALIELALPFLAVQPLVENAVRHGIERRPGGGTVTVAAVGSDGWCTITVADDGVGMDPADRPDDAGLGGVGARLRAAFGDRYLLTVDTALDVGTTVTLRVPALTQPTQ